MVASWGQDASENQMVCEDGVVDGVWRREDGSCKYVLVDGKLDSKEAILIVMCA